MLSAYGCGFIEMLTGNVRPMHCFTRQGGERFFQSNHALSVLYELDSLWHFISSVYEIKPSYAAVSVAHAMQAQYEAS